MMKKLTIQRWTADYIAKAWTFGKRNRITKKQQ